MIPVCFQGSLLWLAINSDWDPASQWSATSSPVDEIGDSSGHNSGTSAAQIWTSYPQARVVGYYGQWLSELLPD